MKRLHLTRALAWLLAATCAHAAAQTSSADVADPQAPVPATRAQPAIDDHAEPAPATGPAMPMPMHEHHAGMDMKDGGTCSGHGDTGAQPAACKPGCCGHKEAP
jgi:hypothetical protein